MKESQDGQQPHLEPGAEGSARWLATEILLNMPDVNVKADIYAVGMVLWFILTEAYPFGTLPPGKIVQHVTCDGGRPPLAPIHARVNAETGALIQWWATRPGPSARRRRCVSRAPAVDPPARGPVQLRTKRAADGERHRCWHAEPALRPSAERLVDELEAIARSTDARGGGRRKPCCVQ